MLSLPNDVREAESEGGRKVLQPAFTALSLFLLENKLRNFLRTAPFLVLLQGSSIDIVHVEPKCLSMSEQHSGSFVNYTKI